MTEEVKKAEDEVKLDIEVEELEDKSAPSGFNFNLNGEADL